MEKIIKRMTTKEITEYIAICSICGKRIIGSTDGQVAFNLILHKQGKSCKPKLKKESCDLFADLEIKSLKRNVK